MEKAFWRETLVLVGYAVAYCSISLDVAAWFSSLSSPFVLIEQRYNNPAYSVASGDGAYECHPESYFSNRQTKLWFSYLVIVEQFVGVAIIGFLNDVFSIEMIHFRSFICKCLKNYFMRPMNEMTANSDTKKYLTRNAKLEQSKKQQDPQEIDLSVEQKHSILTTLIRITLVPPVLILVIYTVLMASNHPIPREGNLPAIDASTVPQAIVRDGLIQYLLDITVHSGVFLGTALFCFLTVMVYGFGGLGYLMERFDDYCSVEEAATSSRYRDSNSAVQHRKSNWLFNGVQYSIAFTTIISFFYTVHVWCTTTGDYHMSKRRAVSVVCVRNAHLFSDSTDLKVLFMWMMQMGYPLFVLSIRGVYKNLPSISDEPKNKTTRSVTSN